VRGASLEVEEGVADDPAGARMQVDEDPGLHFAGDGLDRLAQGHIENIALLVVAIN
jgi:hypothetical protein